MTVSALRTLVVSSPQSIYGGPPLPVPLRWPAAEPGAVLDYSVDVSGVLADVGDTIEKISVQIAPFGPGELAVDTLGFEGGVITVWLSGGIAGRHYLIRIEADTNSKRTFIWLIRLLLDPETAVLPLVPPLWMGFGPITAFPAASLQDSSGNTLEDSSGNPLFGASGIPSGSLTDSAGNLLRDNVGSILTPT